MDIANKKVLIKTWKEIKKASKQQGNCRKSTKDSSSTFFCKNMKPFCGKIVQLDEQRFFDGYNSTKWKCAKWMIQEIIPECPETEEVFNYPLFKRGKGTGVVIKFTSLRTGTVVWKGEQKLNILNIGNTSNSFVRHTNTDAWEDMVYDKDRDLWDGQPIYCWDKYSTHTRVTRFYDAVNKSTFGYKGDRKGATYDNYTPVPPKHYDEWIVDTFNKLRRETYENIT